MPNHIHGIINIVGAGSKPALNHNHLSINKYNHEQSINGNGYNKKIINGKRKRAGLEPAPTCLWQRNYYEHIIRDEHNLNRIREYIKNNPANWDNDENNLKNYKNKNITCQSS